MEYVGVKVFITLGFFACLLFLANWAVNKIDEWFDE